MLIESLKKNKKKREMQMLVGLKSYPQGFPGAHNRVTWVVSVFKNVILQLFTDNSCSLCIYHRRLTRVQELSLGQKTLEAAVLNVHV